MIFLYAFALVAGMLNVFQAGANATLSKSLGQPFVAALIIVIISATTLLLSGLVSGQLVWPEGHKWSAVPWWAWLGGTLGAVVVMSQLLVAQKIGAGAYIGLTITAAAVASIILDHFGWIGFKEHPANLGRIAGAILMVAGVGLIARF